MENTQKLKTTFFRKFFVSIFGIDKYDKISESTVPSFISYILLLSVLVTIILTPVITRTEVEAMDVFKKFIEHNLPNYEVVDGKFKVDSEEPIIRTNKTDYDKMFDGTIILTNYENVEKEHKELLSRKGNLFVFSKDYLLVKQPKTKIVKYKYSSIAKHGALFRQNIKTFPSITTEQKQNEILQKTLVFISIVILLTTVSVTIINVLAISLIAIITSKIMKVKISYSKLFNISCMSITLATMVFVVLTAIMILTKFNFIVPNLDLLYLILTYIYLVVALLLIRRKEIGNQQELIIKEQIVITKKDEEPEEERTDKKQEKDKKKEDKSEKENTDDDNIVKDNT